MRGIVTEAAVAHATTAPRMRAVGTARIPALAVLAATATLPALAAEWTPVVRDPSVREVPFERELHSPDPKYPDTYDPEAQIQIYGGKTPVDTARPPVELGYNFYDEGPLSEGINLIGEKNRLFPQVLLFGDLRSAVAFNDNGKQELAQFAVRANLDLDIKFTATERFHFLFQPLQDGAAFTRYEIGGGDFNNNNQPRLESNGEPTTAFFEGDLAAIVAGLTDEYTSWDLPISFGRMPLLLQNGTWMEDAFLGGAFTIPAKNSPALDITNFDLTFFAGIDEVTSDAFKNAAGKNGDHEAHIYGVAGFFDIGEGYLETGYAYLNDRDDTNGDHSYHNFTLGFSKRYAATVSNATRIIVNVGQDPGTGFKTTANGVLLISENAFITHLPLTLIPYANFWVGIDSTQSAARAAAAGGVLRNIGLNFETDGLTGFPTIDATGVDTYGGAIGLQYLFSLEQQIVGEVAAVIPYDDREGAAQDPQFGFGARYQIPLTNRVIFRADAMYGLLVNADDLLGIRAELRLKL